MNRVEESVVINRPHEEVWDHVTNPANFTSWCLYGPLIFGTAFDDAAFAESDSP